MGPPEHLSGSPTGEPPDEEKPTRPTDSADIKFAMPAAPDGGTRAWLVVAGSACIFFSCLGFINSFGVFQQYYMTHQLQDQSPDNVAWIGSLTSFIQFAGGTVTGPLFDRFGSRIVWPGAVLYLLALMITSICTQYWHFVLVQGVLTGFAMSLLQVPAFAAVGQYFDKKRATALGLVVSGSSLGGIIFPIALSKMLNDSTLGFAWSIRVMAFIVTPLLAFSSFVVAPRLPPREAKFFIAKAFTEVRFLVVIVAAFCCFVGMVMPLFFLPTYAVARGMEPTLASYLLAIINAASTFGRIIPGILADRFGKLNTFGIGAVLTGITILCMNSAVSTTGLVLYAIGFGLSSGTIISGATAALSICTDDLRNLGTYIGMGMAVATTSDLVGPPVDGVLLDKYGGFLQACIFSGVVCLTGGILAFVAKVTMSQGIFGRV